MTEEKDIQLAEFEKIIDEVLTYINLNPPPPFVIKNKNPRKILTEIKKLEVALNESFNKLPAVDKEFYREYTEMITEYFKGMVEYMGEIAACWDIIEQYDNSAN